MKHYCLLAIFLVSSGFSAISQDQSLREIVLQIPPGDNNPRNSEGDFITLKDGRILFVYSYFYGNIGHDFGTARLVGRYSSDKGKTWTKEDITIIPNEGSVNIMSVTLLRLKNGNIALFYCCKNSDADCIPMMRISKDEAKTWSDPVICITDKKGYFVLNNDRVIQLKNGRLLLPVALHKDPEKNVWNDRGKIFVYYSDDNGFTWSCSKEVANPVGIISQEPGVIELKDGTIMMFIRASGGFQQLSYSKDEGETWSSMTASNICSPRSPASIARIPATKDLLMAWNNNDGSNARTKEQRTPLTIAISKDEGKTWENITNIETDPDGCYCYTAIHFTKKDVLLSYSAGSQSKRTHLAITNVSLLHQKDLYKKR